MKERITLEDGRTAERITTVVDGKSTTEIFVEPKTEKKLNSRVTEHTKPVVYRRDIETIHDDGSIETKVESIEPIVTMQTREHILSTPKTEYVTRDDLHDLVVMLKESRPISAQQVVAERVEVAEATTNKWNLFLIVCIALQMAGVVYICLYL